MRALGAVGVAVPLAQGMGDGMGMGWGIAMMLAMLVLFVLVVVGVIWLVQRLIPKRGDGSRSDDRAPEGALEVLERRFAAGEIDAEEYRGRRSILERAR